MILLVAGAIVAAGFLAIGIGVGLSLRRGDRRRIISTEDEYDQLPWRDAQFERLLEDVRRGETSVPEK